MEKRGQKNKEEIVSGPSRRLEQGSFPSHMFHRPVSNWQRCEFDEFYSDAEFLTTSCWQSQLVLLRFIVWFSQVLLGKKKKSKRGKKNPKMNRLSPGTILLFLLPLLIYQLIFFGVLHIWRYTKMLALIIGSPRRSHVLQATATMKSTDVSLSSPNTSGGKAVLSVQNLYKWTPTDNFHHI